MSRDLTIAEAELEVARARARLLDTAAELQDRLNPKTLAREAWEGAKIKGADLAEEAVDAVRARPLAAGGIAAAIALFLAREPIIDMAGKAMDNIGEKRAIKKQRKAAAKQKKKQASAKKRNTE